MVEVVNYDLSKKEVHLNISNKKCERFDCPECGESCEIYDHQKERVWRHLDTMQFQTFIHAKVPRIECGEHGIRTIKLPWAEKHSRFTLLFEKVAIDILQHCSIQESCQLLSISWDEADGIMWRAVRRGLKRKESYCPKRIAIDEIAHRKGQKYLTIVTDHNGGVEYVGKGRSMESLNPYFQSFSLDQLEEIECITMDMHQSYVKSVIGYVPWGHRKIVFDKYHVMAHLNKAVDAVRRAENRQFTRKTDRTLRKTKFLWLYNRENIPEDKKNQFENLRKKNLKVGKAWSMKELFRHFWSYRNVEEAKIFFRRWYFWVCHSKLKPMHKVAETLKHRLENLLTYCSMQVTNAKAESINAKIKQLKVQAHGFRNFNRFRNSILFHLGKLDLYPL